MKAFFLSLLLATSTILAADLPDVTLQPWIVRNIDLPSWTPYYTYGFSDGEGFVLLYETTGGPQNPNRFSQDFGYTWKPIQGQIRGANYVSGNASSYTGNGYFIGYWATAMSEIRGIYNTNELVKGYQKGTAMSPDGVLLGIESYSTYVSTDKGATWTPYLNPFSADGVTLVSFNRVFHDGSSFVGVAAKSDTGYDAFKGSTWRSSDGATWHRILDSDAVSSDAQGRLVVAKAGTIYDLVGDALAPAHAEFPTANASTDYVRVDDRIYAAKDDLLYYSDDKGVTRYRTGFPATITTMWASPSPDGKHIVHVLLSDKRIFASVPVIPMRIAAPGVTLDSIQMRPMLTFKGTSGATVIIEASFSPDGDWSEVARVTATGGTQVWNDNRSPGSGLFYRARVQ